MEKKPPYFASLISYFLEVLSVEEVLPLDVFPELLELSPRPFKSL